MNITTKIEMDLVRRGGTPRLDAVQGDTDTRTVELTLYENGTAWTIPEGVSAAVAYRKPDGTAGLYDTLPDGTAACAVSGNVLAFTMAPQMLTYPGLATVSVILTLEAAQLASFPFSILVERNPGADGVVSQDYFRYTTLEALNNALGDLDDLETADRSSLVAAVNELVSESNATRSMAKTASMTSLKNGALIGSLDALETEDKSSLVAAVNEVLGKAGGNGDAVGGYYTPAVTQVGGDTMQVSFTASKEGMAAVEAQNVTLPAGKDGTSPTVSVSAITDGHRITITDANGTKTIDIMDGADGKDGSDGQAGEDGKPGQDGRDGADGKDYSFDPTIYGLPVLYLTGDVSPIKESKDNKVTLDYVYGDLSGTCTLKGQGATSYRTAQRLGDKGKYNYTVKFDQAFEAADGWGEQEKYCLKANWIDHSHSRNIVSCKLWGMMVKSRSAVPAELAELPNGGAIDGFPIVIMLNGEFHGLYTWNIPKDGWMFGLVEDTAKTQAVVGANDHTPPTQFKGELVEGSEAFEVEFVSDEDNADWVRTSINRLINACIDSDGSDLDTTVAQYIDWDSAIDHYILTVVDKATDCVDKNFLLTTFDGVKWYFTVYDRDSIHGLNWDASGTTRPVSNISFEECATVSRMWELIKRFKTNALKARYKVLRANILSESRIMQTFENFAWPIPSTVLAEDVKRWPSILGSSINTIDQIGRFVRQRLETVDAWVDALPAQETPSGGGTVTSHAVTNKLSYCTSSNGASAVNAGVAYSATITASNGYTLDGASVIVTMGGTDITATAYSGGMISIASVTGAVVITISAVKKASGYTNLVPGSTDTDGSIYNGTGYKDNARLSSSGGVSGSAQAGSVVTGFMPYVVPQTIRIKGATFPKEDGYHYYIHWYDSSKTSLSSVSAAIAADGTNAPGLSMTYDEATGVTTFDFTNAYGGWWTAAANAAYFRLNAKGSGADLIVTVNEEIV